MVSVVYFSRDTNEWQLLCVSSGFTLYYLRAVLMPLKHHFVQFFIRQFVRTAHHDISVTSKEQINN